MRAGLGVLEERQAGAAVDAHCFAIGHVASVAALGGVALLGEEVDGLRAATLQFDSAREQDVGPLFSRVFVGHDASLPSDLKRGS